MEFFISFLESLSEATVGITGNPLVALFRLFRAGGWIVFVPLFYIFVRDTWLIWVQGQFASKKKYVLFAIDVPKVNEQSMKAVEQVIANLHGAFMGLNFKQKWWLGMYLDSFSLEIVSIDGYIQYFVRTEVTHADLIKGAIFAQYPDAEIIEVDDYVVNVPQSYPDEKYDMFGSELVFAKPDAYPIKTYEAFEHPLTGVYADPMAAILELMSRIRPGEQVWLQLIITPEGPGWRANAQKEVNKIIGRKAASKASTLDKVLYAPVNIVETLHNALFKTTGVTTVGDQAGEMGNYLNLTPGEQWAVMEIQKKMARLLFLTKFRFLYFAPKEIFNTNRVVLSIMGAIKQFNTLDVNAFAWGRKTSTLVPHYFFMNWQRNNRKNRILIAYKNRSNWEGEALQVWSNVEIASVFHFPIMQVKAPLVSKTVAKKSEPPAHLPLEMPFTGTPEAIPVQEPQQAAAVSATPSTARPGLKLPPAPPAVSQNDNTIAAPLIEGEQLHSMPGLPPGVHPIRTFHGPQSNVEGSAVTSGQPIPTPPTATMPAVPPVTQPSPKSDTESQRGTPPPNLPI